MDKNTFKYFLNLDVCVKSREVLIIAVKNEQHGSWVCSDDDLLHTLWSKTLSQLRLITSEKAGEDVWSMSVLFASSKLFSYDII